jgi:hypothetical protein
VITIEVEGASRVAGAFLGLVRALRVGLRESWALIGARAVASAVPLVPVASARLVNSLTAVPGGDGVDVQSDVVYAAVQNYGWAARNIEGHEFMAPAEDVLQNDSADVLSSGIQTLIRRAGLD